MVNSLSLLLDDGPGELFTSNDNYAILQKDRRVCECLNLQKAPAALSEGSYG